MTLPVPVIRSPQAPSAPDNRTAKLTGDSFETILIAEKADALMHEKGLRTEWDKVRHNTNLDIGRIAEATVARNALINDSGKVDSADTPQFNQLTEGLRQIGLPLPRAEELQDSKKISKAEERQPSLPQATAQSEVATVTASSSLITEENLLILSLENPDIGIRETILGYGDQTTTQLPLKEVTQVLDFSIEVDEKKGIAKGWFIAEENSFFLDANSNTIRIGDSSQTFDDGLVSIGENDIFIDNKVLGEWFPVDFDVSLGELSVYVNPRQKLPVQAAYEREQSRLNLLGKEDMSLRYPLLDNEYKMFSFPMVDVSLSGGVLENSDDGNNFRSGYSIVAEGDFAYMGAQVFLGGDEDDWLDSARIRLERYDADGNLLGPLNATQISLGDITPVDIPVLDRAGFEQGIKISNGDYFQNEDFDSTRFEGNVLPGWDVELYRNGSLVEGQRVGGDGRYIFDEIPIFFGSNTFEVIAFGPQGQRRVLEDKDLNVGSRMLPTGKIDYSFSLSEASETVLGIDEQGGSTGEGIRINSRGRLGLNENLSLLGGFSSVDFSDERHNYLQVGVGGTFSSFYGQADYVQDLEGGSGVAFLGQTSLGSVNVNAKYEQYFDFISESNPNSALDSRVALGVSGSTPKAGILPSLFYTLNSEYTTYEDWETGHLSARLSGNVNSLNFSNVINWNTSSNENSEVAPVDGTFQLSHSMGSQRITGSLSYDLGDESRITKYGLSGTRRLTDEVRAGADLIYYDEEEKHTSIKGYLDWDNGKFNLSPSVTYDTEDGFGAFLTLSTSLSKNPFNDDISITSERQSGNGAATAFVYHDANNNRKFDENDTPLEYVDINARQARKRVMTDETGVAYIQGLASHDPTDIEVDVESLEDPFWYPATDGVAIAPRAGSVHQLEFPVVSTGEIDGTVYILDSNGAKQELANVKLEILDGEGNIVQTTESEYDGFYLFQKVFPGAYTLRVSPDEPKYDQYAAGLQVEIFIENDGTIVSGNDFVFPQTPVEFRDGPEVNPLEESTTERSVNTEEIVAAVDQQTIQQESTIGLGLEETKDNLITDQALAQASVVKVSPLEIREENGKYSLFRAGDDNQDSNIQVVAAVREGTEKKGVRDIGQPGDRGAEKSQDEYYTNAEMTLAAADKPVFRENAQVSHVAASSQTNSISAPSGNITPVSVDSPELRGKLGDLEVVVVTSDYQDVTQQLAQNSTGDKAIALARLERSLEKMYGISPMAPARIKEVQDENRWLSQASQKVIRPIEQPIIPIGTPIDLGLSRYSRYRNQVATMSGSETSRQPSLASSGSGFNNQQIGHAAAMASNTVPKSREAISSQLFNVIG